MFFLSYFFNKTKSKQNLKYNKNEFMINLLLKLSFSLTLIASFIHFFSFSNNILTSFLTNFSKDQTKTIQLFKITKCNILRSKMLEIFNILSFFPQISLICTNFFLLSILINNWHAF
eukprot:TRINITY_DN8283_c0_g1_i1.p5 TRINITY_DN8283_c0_g1~~TRINITY_DN8283_c0_g1_i1.p5  ORF type:complete len:117 (+),score=2.52 TRINITY_DN8283_c0_g1_i1:606-956(+)